MWYPFSKLCFMFNLSLNRNKMANEMAKEYASLIDKSHKSVLSYLNKMNSKCDLSRYKRRFYWAGIPLKYIYLEEKRIYGIIHNDRVVDMGFSHELIFIADFLKSKIK